jgi:exopolysaccharide biosynthesis polyprenyl glycosylphosphotransferase
MSDQTAIESLAATPRALELHPPRSVRARRGIRSSRARLSARLSIDVGSILCAAIAVEASATTPLQSWTVVLAGLAIIAGYAAAGLYSLNASPKLGTELLHVLSVPALVVMALAGIELAFGRQDIGDTAVRFWLLAATMTGAGRLSVNGAHALMRRGATVGRANTLIVGAGRVGHLAAKRLLDDPALGMRPIGFLDKDPLAPKPDAEAEVTLPVLGASYDLEQVVGEHEVEYVLIAFSTAPSHVVLDVVRRCWALGVSVMLVPRLYEVEGRRSRTEHLGALPLVTLSPSDPGGWRFTAKYVADRVIAGISLVLLAPLLAVVALAILIASGRPLLFRQRRVGRDGHLFEMLKFRTMRGTPELGGELDAEWAALSTGMGPRPDVTAVAVADDRRTGLGAMLRKLSIDELPQLWNVLRGDMSIVGPRPERVHYVELFENAIYRYPDRHRVKSGLTGWAQVNGLRGETSLADRIEWDNFYIENWSPWLDLKILLKTIPALVAGRGAR